ncbi:hypothetical protein ID866_6530 [Astraeus odoratus]|nr:hypothetical protein ID866_6530 [Astraeus odoratus]
MLIMGEGGKHRIAEEFLALVVQQDPEIRVIVDAGAQVLELANREFAEDWLRLKPDASAAIYFNQEDELMVLTREGREQLLLESGTDIKLPIGFRAAITLGPNITKDRLTQGSKTLEDLYAPACPSTFSNTNISDTSDVKHIIQRCRFLGVQISLPITDAVHEEREQVREREVAYEINYEHVESSPKAIPSVPFVDEDVRRFVQNGKVVLQHQSEAFLPLCMYFGRSSTCHEPAVWTKDILMTVDFCRVTWKEKTSEKYHRPVNWILSDQSPGGPPTLVILSPFEVSALLPEIKRSKYVHLHVYAPRVQQARRSCDDLCFYTIPPIPCDWSAPTQIIDQLNIFSGQLYLSDKSTYLRLCCFLSVYAPDLQDERDLEVQSDGFIKPVHLIRTSRPMSQALNFRESPLTFIKEHITHCRMGVPFTLSHMGKILDGHLLQDEDFDQHYI